MSDGNFLSFLFGNVAEDGRLDNDDMDEDLKATLAGPSSMLSQFLQSSMLTGDEDVNSGSTSGAGAQAMADGRVKADASAVDFTEIDEVIEDSSLPAAAPVVFKSPEPAKSSAPTVPPPVVVREREQKPTLVQKFLQNFSPDSDLQFTQLVFAPGQYDKPIGKTRASIRRDGYINASMYKVKPSAILSDDKNLFNSDVLLDEILLKRRERDADEFGYKSLLKMAESGLMRAGGDKISSLDDDENMEVEESESSGDKDDGLKTIAPIRDSMFHPINLEDWEAEIIWDEPPLSSVDSGIDINRFFIPDYDLVVGDWTEKIIWDDVDVLDTNIPVEIPLNDPNLIIDIIRNDNEPSDMPKRPRAQVKRPLLSTGGYNDMGHTIPHGFNLSNDRYYEIHHKHGKLQRANLSKAYLEHSFPAMQLQLPFFRRYMSKSDLRSFHRPALQIQADEKSRFARIKNLKSRKRLHKGQSISDILQTIDDITLRDNSSYVLFEYSEEYPAILSNYGMGSHIVNYYRKKDEKDPFIPKVPYGQPHVLEQFDASPFFLFGQIPPGDSVTAIRNNMYTAPIFQHKLKNDDFLLIRYTPKYKKKKEPQVTVVPKATCYVREIPTVFTVGQLFPLSPIHPPQSRKIKLFIRDRLKVLALRRIKKRGRHAKYPVHHIVNSFHRYQDQSIRKHLKDFADVIRGPNGTQYLKIHSSVPIPSEQELYKMVTPEMVCVFEALRVGQQRLADIGYGTWSLNAGDDNAEGEEGTLLDDEVQFAPWNTSSHFLLAAQHKGMIQVYGPGDPTGRGEAFSFFRFSMKEMFTRAGASSEEVEAYYQSQTKTGHKFSITDQQKVYQEELNRVWAAQRNSLSTDIEIQMDNDDVVNGADYNADNGVDADEEREFRELMDEMGQGGDGSSSPMPSVTASSMAAHREADNQSMVSFSSRNLMPAKRALLIRRLINGVWQEEAVTNLSVINPYLQCKRLLELGGEGKNAFSIEDDEEIRKKKIKNLIKLWKQKSGYTKQMLINEIKQKKQEEGSERLGISARKCRSCGQVGHISTNKICPDYAKNFPERAREEAELGIKIDNFKMVFSKKALQNIDEDKKRGKGILRTNYATLADVPNILPAITPSTSVPGTPSTGAKRQRTDSSDDEGKQEGNTGNPAV